MATRTFADLSPYRRAVSGAQAGSNLLDSLIQGIQGGIQLQQLPGKIQENQLAQQLQNAINQQKLQDLQNPQAALIRDIERQLTLKGALNPELGIVRAQPGLVGETIFNPGAITPQQQVALATTPTVVPTAPAVGVPETPISAFGIQTGLNIDPNIPEQAQEDKLNRQIQLANTRARTAGLKGKFIDDGRGGLIWAQEPTVTGGEIKTTRVTTPEGEAVKVVPKPGKAAGGLTPNAQMVLFGQATAAGIDPDNPKYRDEETGVYDFARIAMDKGKAVRENKRLDNVAKASVAKGKTQTDLDALNAAEKQLHILQDEIQEIVSSGKTPGALDDMVAAETSAPATGGISALWRRFVKGFQSDESKIIEGKKSVISSALIKAISGLAVSKDEARRLGFVPNPGDSFQELLMKASLVEDYINAQRSGLSGEPNAPRESPTPAPTAQPTGLPKVIKITPRAR